MFCFRLAHAAWLLGTSQIWTTENRVWHCQVVTGQSGHFSVQWICYINPNQERVHGFSWALLLTCFSLYTLECTGAGLIDPPSASPTRITQAPDAALILSEAVSQSCCVLWQSGYFPPSPLFPSDVKPSRHSTGRKPTAAPDMRVDGL